MTNFNYSKHVKLSITLEVIIDNGFGVRRGLSENELLVLDTENTIKAILPIYKETTHDNITRWDYVNRADLVREFSKLGVILK